MRGLRVFHCVPVWREASGGVRIEPKIVSPGHRLHTGVEGVKWT